MADRDQLQEIFARILLARVRQDRYPSATHMAILEQSLPPDMLDDYINVLFEKVLTDPVPSITMLRRIQRLTQPAA
jgi:hypothetical protein